LLGWGGSTLEQFDQRALDAYRKTWRDPATIEAMCNDYRAALDYDFDLDQRDLPRQLDLPALVMWGAGGAMDKSFDLPETWRARLKRFECSTIAGGHFFPDIHPKDTAAALLCFLKPLSDY
jgi:haloacetate dehalogenase